MSLSKSKCQYSNNCLQFLKRPVPLTKSNLLKISGSISLQHFLNYFQLKKKVFFNFLVSYTFAEVYAS